MNWMKRTLNHRGEIVTVQETSKHACSQDWDVRPIAGLIGVEVRGFALGELTPAQAEDIRWLLATHGVVIFTGQSIGPKDHVSFAKSIGTIKMPNAYLDPSALVEGHPEIATFSTENKYAYQTDRWHADVTMLAEPNRFSILHMQQVPASGGDTQWSSDYAAYDRLSDSMRQFLDPLTVLHQHPFVEDRQTVHPLVLAHPLTGRRSLFLNNTHAKRIVELTEGESAALLKYLGEYGTQPEMICRWRWTEGDVAIWENHYVQHYAIYDYGAQARKIHRIEVDAEAPSAANTGRAIS
jgi:taurine dioxygenase